MKTNHYQRARSTMSRSILSIMFIGLSLPISTLAGEFLAYPGLWKTTVQLLGDTSTARSEPQVKWHCVDEAEDPWTAFAQLAMPAGDLCVQTQTDRTSTSLAWKVECKAPTALANSGHVIFDSPSHYRGEVQLSGQFMGYPVNSRVIVEGQRYAACTSPSD